MTTNKEKHECCGKPMTCLGNVDDMCPDIDNRERWVCLECGGFFEITEGQMELEDLKNNINTYGSYTDKKKFVELHPELSDEVV